MSRLFRPASERTTGLPTSSNGASSFHLFWGVSDQTFNRLSATIEILEPPRVDHLFFWALQVDFVAEAGRRGGGAHLGLQHHPSHPGGGAVNWGGYGTDGSILAGSDSALPSALSNPNTRDFRWTPHHPYRLTVSPTPGVLAQSGSDDAGGAHSWRGSITDLETGEETVVRELLGEGSMLTRPMVWSEVFARCDDPTVTVRWSDFEAETSDGIALSPDSVRVNYQTMADGGCTNTDVVADNVGFCQRTNSMRRQPQGSIMRLQS